MRKSVTMDELIRLRHELHRNPELSGHERATGKRLRFYLKKYKPNELITGIAGRGMAAVFNGSEPGPTVLIRCDLDAVPIQETSGKPHSSVANGASHACGHDGHMVMVSGLASQLNTNPPKRGRVILFYQPEEENGRGAKNSIEHLRRLNLFPDFAFALHNMPKYPIGSIVLAKHTFAAASKGMIIKLIGKNSHAAFPEKGINPALAIAEITQELCLLANKSDFDDFVLTTVIHIRLGDVAFGTSPGYGELMLTLRSFDNEDMEKLTAKTVQIAEHIGIKHGLSIETHITDDYPAAVNHPELKLLVKELASKQDRVVVRLKEPNRWSDDFAHFAQEVPSIIFGLGVGEDAPDLHSPDYDFPDEAIEHGIEIFDSIVSHYLR
ncbi:MAG: amidohydrolase [Bacteroidales bacterium]|nr:amidohydrolase [Bacteroidales bacterium]